jgi:hypothetical protein
MEQAVDREAAIRFDNTVKVTAKTSAEEIIGIEGSIQDVSAHNVIVYYYPGLRVLIYTVKLKIRDSGADLAGIGNLDTNAVKCIQKILVWVRARCKQAHSR